MTNLLIPKSKAKREIRRGYGDDFWKDYWEKFDEPERYTRRVSSSRVSTSKITRLNVPTEKKLYAEVTLDEQATSKTKKPSEIWKTSNIDIVKSKDGRTFTISGTKNNFKKLEKIFQASSFDSAKTGEGIKKVEKNKFRELYAITKISDRNSDTKSRLSRELQNIIEDNNDDELYCIIEIYSDQPKSEYGKLYKILNDNFENKIKKRDEELFFSNMSFNAYLRRNEIKDILGDIKYNFISQIKLHPFLSVQRCVPNVELDDIKIGPLLTDEKIAIIDSGIDNILLNKIVVHRYNFVKGKKTDSNHGTFVASRAIFGEGIFNQVSNKSKTVLPAGEIIDIKVLFDDTDNICKVDVDDLQKAIKEVVKRHDDVKVFNVSINHENQIEDGVVEELTEVIDVLAREYDVIIVCSTGNQKHYKHSPYEDLFEDVSLTTKIACPADALNALTVGSIAKNADTNSICKNQLHPSPFTRNGGIRNNWKKPDLVIDGGNIKEDKTRAYNTSHMSASNMVYGVEGIDSAGLNKDIGTSFSAPLISNQCLLLLDYIKKSNLNSFLNLDGNYSNLVKALLIHSTHRTKQADMKKANGKKAYGFGIPDYKNVLKDDENQFSFIYADNINAKERKHKINFQLPDFLLKKPVEFIFTFVYNPPVNKNFPDEYKMLTLKPTIRAVHPKKGKSGLLDDAEYKTICTDNSWERYRNSSFNVVHYRMKKKELSSVVMEILVQMEIYDKYEDMFIGREDKIEQNYSLVLTVIDCENNKKLNDYIISSNQFNVLVENQIQVQN